MFGLMASPETTVLLVEDDAVVAEIYALSLNRAGFKVITARDGEAALVEISTQLPDFIFLDLRMPRMDGIEFLRALGGRGPINVPIVMLSNFDDPVLIKESIQLGAREYRVKADTNPADLPAIVERWLGRAA